MSESEWALSTLGRAGSLNGGFISSVPPNVLAPWLVCIHAWGKTCSVAGLRVFCRSGVGVVS